ncbi:MAG: putative colanic acid biosynthesis acetyltransferase [Verrucomicrobiota bacterium]|nr:putative colanic acid biosynthesis acetyltransferase [Verrucomicrobiota bacterium]
MNTYFDNYDHRDNDNYKPEEYRKRVLWALFGQVFHWIPRPCYEARNRLLRLFGAQIGKQVRIYPDTVVMYPWNLSLGDYTTIGPKVDIYNLGKVTLGNHVLVSKGAHFCAGTHNYHHLNLPLLKPEIVVRDEVWFAADVFIGPNVTIGKGAIIGARAVVLKDVPEAAIVGGNPARVLKLRQPSLPSIGLRNR